MLIRPFPKHSIRFAKKYFKSFPPITAVEIGTFRGVNAKYMLDNLKIKKLYLVDPYNDYIDGSNGPRSKIKRKDLVKPKRQAHQRLKKWDKKRVLKWVEKYSNDAAKEIPLVDYVYIDGAHIYERVLDDLNNYYPKLKESGIMAGHDIHVGEVIAAVQDFAKKKNIHFQVAGQDWWFMKPPR